MNFIYQTCPDLFGSSYILILKRLTVNILIFKNGNWVYNFNRMPTQKFIQYIVSQLFKYNSLKKSENVNLHIILNLLCMKYLKFFQ